MAHYDVRVCSYCGEKFVEKENAAKTFLLADARAVGNSFASEFGAASRMVKGIAKSFDTNKYFCSEACKLSYEEQEKQEKMMKVEQKLQELAKELQAKRHYFNLCVNNTCTEKPKTQLKTIFEDYEISAKEEYLEESSVDYANKFLNNLNSMNDRNYGFFAEYYENFESLGKLCLVLIERVKPTDPKYAAKMLHKYNCITWRRRLLSDREWRKDNFKTYRCRTY